MSFVNISNHPTSRWTKDQLDAAQCYSPIILDIQFPIVQPDATTADVQRLAYDVLSHIRLDCRVAHVVGEPTLTYALVHMLWQRQILCVAATTERVVQEHMLEDGSVLKESVFKFVQFRNYFLHF